MTAPRTIAALAAALAAGLITWLLVGAGNVVPGGGASAAPGGLVSRRMTYRFGWEGLPGGEVALTVKPAVLGERRAWWVSYEAQSGPALRPVGAFRASGWSLVGADRLRPLRSRSTTWRRDSRKERTARFDYQAGVAVVTEHEYPEDETERLEVPLNGHLDPASLLLRAAAGRLPARALMLVGDDQYELTCRGEDTENVAAPGGWRQARRWALTVRDAEPDADEQGEHGGRLWLSRAGGVPLRLEADLLVGRLTVRLVSAERITPGGADRPERARTP
ncbi:MAG: DUF3108 domain-containing protein [Candidatus Brocadiia bacterium]